MTNRARIWMCVYFLGLLVSIGVGYQLFESTPAGRKISESLWGLNLLHYSEILDKLSRNEGQVYEEAIVEELEKTFSYTPTLSHSSGIYPDGVVVTATLPQNTIGYYSVDGSVPTPRHNRVSAPIRISKSTVLRVRSFDESSSSPVVSATYLVTNLSSIAAANLVMDPVYLFDRHAGIYSNPTQKGRAWERPAVLNIIDPVSGRTLEAKVRVRIHGGTSRGSAASIGKSFRIIFSGQDNDLTTWLSAPPNEISPNQLEWVLRHVGNKRQLWSDRFTLRVARQLGLVAGISQPVVLYLNGKKWGAYDLIERINEEFLESKTAGQHFTLLHGPPLIEPFKKSRAYSEWNRFYRFVSENDLSDPGAYAFVESQLDIKSLIDYYALAIFMADSDRPQGNTDIFRAEQGPDGRPGKWMFAVWDYDGGLNYGGIFTRHDTLAWHLRSSLRIDLKPSGVQDNARLLSATRLLRALMQNLDFREAFKRRFNHLLETTFSANNLKATLDEMLHDYSEILPLERQRINKTTGGLTAAEVEMPLAEAEFTYDDRMAEIHSFISERPGIVAELLQKHLGAKGP